jgi:hypothetical protein
VFSTSHHSPMIRIDGRKIDDFRPAQKRIQNPGVWRRPVSDKI